MFFRSVKQSPILDRVEQEMRKIGMGTFLGKDTRRLSEILDDDKNTMSSLGLTHHEIASRLEKIAVTAKKNLGDYISVGDRYEVMMEVHRGMIPCPWMHPGGLFYKSYMELHDRITVETVILSDLSIHLIRDHGFYQGKGSPFRLEPKLMKRILFDPS
jgi:hypothetical protein